VEGERISYVGSNAGVEAYVSEATKVVEADGRLVLPGFIDSHNHVRSGSNPDVVSLFGAESLAELQERIGTFARERPDLEWIRGDGWNYSVLPDARLPTADDLDGLTGGRPAFLVSYDAHTIWLNHAAMERMNITPETKSVPFGELVLDERGRPIGVLKGTMGLTGQADAGLGQFLPDRDDEDRFASLKQNLSDAARFGITTIVDPQASVRTLATYERARDEGYLKSRLQVALYHPPGTTQEEVERFAEARQKYDDDRIRVSAIKLYIDDVIEPHTAALLEPYSDLPGERGDTFYTPETFNGIVTRLDGQSFQLFIHAIGDRGIRVALDALEEARRANGPRDSRHELVHVELLSPQDVPRFKELDVTACMQPRHCAPDITGKWAANVGPERAKYAWAFRSLEEAGARLAFASDWDVSEMEPVVGIYTAVTRRALDGTPPEGWIPEQRVSVETAVEAYTRGGAYANFLEDNRGSIEVGKYADLVVLSDNLFEIRPEEIKATRVLLTLVGGEEVYSEL
jgi:predicted amidohydrolase YtcJ